MFNKLYLAGGVAVLGLFILIEATGWDLFGSGGASAGPSGAHAGGRQGSGYHAWGIGGGK